jgi:hypothetical protein
MIETEFAFPTEVFLTFDIEGPPGREDWMDLQTRKAIRKTLELMETHKLRGLFFISGTIAEELCADPHLFQLLNEHEIGSHSTSHSIKPRVCEYTDLAEYDRAVRASILSESSTMISRSTQNKRVRRLFLNELFPNKKIEAFRVPFDYFSPPHIDALKKLGFRFVFSGDIAPEPVFFSGLTFYPKAIFMDGFVRKFIQFDYPDRVVASPFLLNSFGKKNLVFAFHPSEFAYQINRNDLRAFYKNPKYGLRLKSNHSIATSSLNLFELFLSKLQMLQRLGVIEVTPDVKTSEELLNPEKVDIQRNINYCMRVATELFGYKPKFLLSQYTHFFGKRHN